MAIDVIIAVLVGLIAVLLIAAFIILCTPLEIEARADSSRTPQLIFRIALLGGLGPAMTMDSKNLAEDKSEPVQRRNKDKPQKKQRSNNKASSFNFTSYAMRMVREAPGYLSKLAACVKFKTINADVEFGCPDPADTGVIYGAMTPIVLLANTATSSHLNLQPDFAHAKFRFSGQLTARLTPAALAPPTFGFGWSVFVSPNLPGWFR